MLASDRPLEEELHKNKETLSLELLEVHWGRGRRSCWTTFRVSSTFVCFFLVTLSHYRLLIPTHVDRSCAAQDASSTRTETS